MITFRFEFEPRDLWIGVHWKYRAFAYDVAGVKLSASERAVYDQAAAAVGAAEPRPRFDLWLCLLPCLPLHVTWWGKEAKSPENASWSNLGPSENALLSRKEFDRTEEELLQQILGSGTSYQMPAPLDPDIPPSSLERFRKEYEANNPKTDIDHG